MIFLTSGTCFAREPVDTTFHNVVTSRFIYSTADTSLYIWLGSKWDTIKLAQPGDTVKITDFLTKYQASQKYKEKPDSIIKSGFVPVWRLTHKIDSIMGLVKYRNDSILMSGYLSIYMDRLNRKLNDHDSLFTLQEKNYSSLDGKPDLTVFRQNNDHDSLQHLDERQHASLTDILGRGSYHVSQSERDSITSAEQHGDTVRNEGHATIFDLSQLGIMPNDTWWQSYDYAGNLVNVAKVSKDNLIEFGLPVGIGKLHTVADAGKVRIADMPNIRSASGDTLQFSMGFNGQDFFKVRGIADGSGGLSDTTVIIPKLRLTNKARNGYYLQIVDALGTVKAVPMNTGWQGTWNATTNTPTLANGTGTAGYWYRCLTAGTTDFGAGDIVFEVGDEAHYNGSIWQNAGGSNTYDLQVATKTVLGGVKLDSTTIKYNASGQLRVDTTLIASAKALSTHAGLTTTAHSLGASAFHPDAYFKLGNDSVLNPGYVTNWKLRLYRLLNNHDSLSVLDEKSYNSLTDKPNLAIYRQLNDPDSLSHLQERSYLSLTDVPDLTQPLLNDQWFKSYDYAGNSVNLFKISKDNMFTIAPKFGVNAFNFGLNQGFNYFADLPLSPLGVGITHGTGVRIGGVDAMKVYGVGNSSGSIDTAFIDIKSLIIRTGAAANKIALSKDSRGLVNWSDAKYLFSLVANRILYASATNEMGQLPLGTANQPLLSGGANTAGWASYTLPTTATTGKILIGDGTNFVLSTPTFPNASATFGKIIKSDGTNWVASTETYAVPGTNGNLYSSDGTNWTSVSRGLGLTSTWTLAVDTASASILSRQRALKEYMPKVYPGAGIVVSTGSAWGSSITDNHANWDKYNQWNGGSTDLVAATGRTSLGGTTVGQAMFTLTNPSATTFLQLNADNSVTAKTASDFRTAIGAGTSSTAGTVTSVAALTLGTTGTDLSSTVATGTTTPVITLNVPTSSASNRGALSSTDWSTFNGKQTALNGTGFIKISGTTISYDNSTYLTTETDPTIYAWAKASTKPSYTYSEVGAEASGTMTSHLSTYTHANIANGQTAYGWGNHASAGYAVGTINNATLTLAVSGSGLSGSQTFTANQSTGATFTVTSNATTSNTASTIVLRDGSGYVALSGTFCSSSDSTLKKNIKPFLKTDLYNASKIDFRKFVYKADKTDHLHFGGIAQQIEKYVPEVVYINKVTGKKEVNYPELLVIVAAQQKEEIKLLKDRIESLEKMVNQLVKMQAK